MKKPLKKIILRLISWIEKIEHRNLSLDQNDPDKKIISEHDIDIEVLSDSGLVKAFKFFETQPYNVWFLELENGKKIDCADNHIVFDENLREIFVGDLKIGSLVMTSEGPSRVIYLENTKIPVSMVDLSIDHPDHRYYTNEILSHNSIMSGVMLVWYLLFNHDKNAMLLANVGATAEELMSKIKEIIKGLPWFLKPGIVVNNVMSLKFDNGCRAIAKTTTKTSAIGFTIHFLYMDEFAHIHPNFIESFFRSTYPTVSSSKVSRIIITSTPNGQNKFWEIYQGAMTGDNTFNPIRVDWWQVPGRDESWRKDEIANLGSEELFNQEYGNQFLSSSTLLLGSKELQKLKSNEIEYVWKEVDALDDTGIKYHNFFWHPKFDPNGTDLFGRKYVLSIDLAGGGGGDFTVLNVFKVIPLPKKAIEELDEFEDESDFFGLLQVGVFRDNSIEVEDFKKIVECLIVDIFEPDRVKVLLEINYKGELLMDKLLNNNSINEEVFVYTKHSETARIKKPGIKYSGNNKLKYCENLRQIIRKNRALVNEKKWTIAEMFSFGMNGRGTYSSQSGHDDVAMTLVNLSALFDSSDFNDLIEDLYDEIDPSYRRMIEKKVDGENFTPEEGGMKTKDGGFHNSFNSLL